MSATTVYRFEIYCETEAKWVDYWHTSLKGVCPNNKSHTVTAGSDHNIQEVNEQTVKVREESGITGGNFILDGRNWDCIPVSQDDGYGPGVTVTTHIWGYPIGVLGLWASFRENNMGDVIDIVANPETPVGVLTAPALAGDTVLNVSSTVIQYMKRGYDLYITDGVNTEDLEAVTNVDMANSQVTVIKPLQNNYSPLSPTIIKMSVYFVKNMEIGAIGRFAVGTTKIGGAMFPAGVSIVVKYYNKTNETKRIVSDLEYLY